MKLTILGNSPALPRPGGACSGYLVESGDTRVLLDCGTGVLSKLMLVADFRTIDAVVISHWHADHWFDLVPYRYGLLLTNRPSPLRPSLYLPPDGISAVETVAKVFDPSGNFFGKCFAVSEYDPEQHLSIGGLRLSFARAKHVLPTWALRVSASDSTLAYSADTGPSDDIARIARHADLFLCEATLQGPGDDSSNALHLSAAQAAKLAARAGVRRLILTHIWSELDPERSLVEARQFFPRTILGRELESYEIP